LIVYEMFRARLSEHHFFFMPTANENFGHAIVEALLAGCPLITSDQTPWRELARRGVGWDLPLHARDEGRRALPRDAREEWGRVMQACVDMDEPAFERASRSARSFGQLIASTDTDR